MKHHRCLLLRFLRDGLLWGIFFFVTACSGHSDTTLLLHEAEQQLATAPDSAYVLLAAADTTLRFNRAERAEWNLLFTQAMDKSYREHTTDSLIRLATAYFEKQNNPDRLILAYYTQGRVVQELGDAPQAQECYLRALKEGEHSKDLKLLARIEFNLGNLYLFQHAFTEALPHLTRANDYFEALDDSVSLSYGIQNIARAYTQRDSLDRALESYQKALSYADEVNISAIYNEMGSIYITKKDFVTAYSYLQKALALSAGKKDYSPYYLAMGHYFVAVNDRDSARFYLSQSMKSPRKATEAGSYYYLAELAYKNKEWKEYADFSRQYEALRTALVKEKNNESIERMQKLYDYTIVKEEAEKYQLKHTIARKNMAILGITIGILVVLSFFLISNFKKEQKKGKKEIDQLIKQFQMNESQRYVNMQRIAELEGLIKKRRDEEKEELIREKKILECETNTLLLRQDMKRRRDDTFRNSSIYVYCHKNANLGRIEMKDKRKLFDEIDNVYIGFKEQIEERIPNIKAHELEICYFLKADFTMTDIVRFLSLHKSTLWMRLGRTIKKINNSEEKMSNEDFKAWVKSI